jgi:hypothetical protein
MIKSAFALSPLHKGLYILFASGNKEHPSGKKANALKSVIFLAFLLMIYRTTGTGT